MVSGSKCSLLYPFLFFATRCSAGDAVLSGGSGSGKDAGAELLGTGSVMPLTEAGYHQVAVRRNGAEMEAFIRRVLRQKGMGVEDVKGLQDFARFFSGTHTMQSLADLKSALDAVTWVAVQDHEAKAAPSAHDAGTLVDEAGFQSMVKEGSEAELKSLIRSLLRREWRRVVQKDEFVNFVRTLRASGIHSQTLQEVLELLRSAEWAQPVSDAARLETHAKAAASERRNLLKRGGAEQVPDATNEALHLGHVAPLTEGGYQSVAAMEDDEQMKNFVRRVIAKDGGEVTDEGELSGLVSYYSGSSAVQTLEALQSELAGATWVHRGGLQSIALLRQGAHVTRRANDTSNVTNGTSGGMTASAIKAAAGEEGRASQHSAVVISGNGEVTTELLPPVPRLVFPAEESMHKLQEVAQEMKFKANQDYEKQKTQLRETRSAYQADLESLENRNTEFASFLEFLEANISALEANSSREKDEALSLQAQNHARMQVMHTLRDRLATTVAFLEDAGMANSSSVLGEHIAERQDFHHYLLAAREELGLNRSFNGMGYHERRTDSASLLQVGTGHGSQPGGELSEAEDAEADELEVRKGAEQATAAHETVMSLTPALASMNKASEAAREVLKANYEASAKVHKEKFDALTAAHQQLVQRQQDATFQHTQLAEARAKLNSIKIVVGERIAWLKTFMVKASYVASSAAADATKVMEDNE